MDVVRKFKMELMLPELLLHWFAWRRSFDLLSPRQAWACFAGFEGGFLRWSSQGAQPWYSTQPCNCGSSFLECPTHGCSNMTLIWAGLERPHRNPFVSIHQWIWTWRCRWIRISGIRTILLRLLCSLARNLAPVYCSCWKTFWRNPC